MTKLKISTAFFLLIYGNLFPVYGADVEKIAPGHHFEKTPGVFARGNHSAFADYQPNPPPKRQKIIENMLDIRIPIFQKLNDSDLSKRINMENISRLRALIAPFKSITDESFGILSRATHLKVLDLSENKRITDSGIEKIQHLEHLEILRLSSTEITDVSAAYIIKFINLKELNVLNTFLTKKAIDEIKKSIPALQAPGAFIYNPFLDMKE